MRFLICLTALCIGTAAQADLAVRFIEGAPKDRFVFVASNSCIDGPAEIIVDLSGSDAGLIFDISDAGAGVEVFQPFELVAGGDLVASRSVVSDGDQVLTMSLTSLPANREVSFTIDLDDTSGGREITVSGSEIAGARVGLRIAEVTSSAAFNADATALISVQGCNS